MNDSMHTMSDRIRPNILLGLATGVVILSVTGFFAGADSVSTGSAILLGGVVSVIGKLIDPPPVHAVPSSVVDKILEGFRDLPSGRALVPAGGGDARDATHTLGDRIRPNVLLGLVTGVVILGVTGVFAGAEAVSTGSNILLGGVVSVIGKLIDPPPVHAVPSNVVDKILEAYHERSFAQTA
jgi:hypothetical protein